MHKHLSLFFRLSAAVLVLFFAFPQGIFAAEIRNPLNKAVWYKYGVNPYSTDTDNDGFSDVWEIQQNYCPTYPGIIALSDEQCQKGSFNLVRQTYVAPKGVSFYPSRSMTKVPSCQAFEALLARDTTGFQSLDVVSAGVGMYGADDPSLMVQEGSNVIVLSGQTVRIIDTKTTPERVTTLTISNESGFRPDRLYVRSSTVMIVGSVVSSTASHKEIVRTELWDIQDNSRPRRVRSVDVSGSLLGTYRTSDMVYMAMSPEGYRNDEAVRGGAYSQFKVPRLMEGIWLYRDARSQFQKIDALSWKTLAGCTSLEYAAPLWGKGMIHIVGFSLKNPQAALITAIAQGVLGGNLDWGLIGLGAAIGAAVIVADELLRKTGKRSLPPLAVGMGIYLPMALTLLIPLGALAGHFYNRWAVRQSDPEFAERMGVLAATGLIVGESLFGVFFAGIAAATGSPEALAVLESNPFAELAGLAVFAGSVGWLYRWTRRAVSSS